MKRQLILTLMTLFANAAPLFAAEEQQQPKPIIDLITIQEKGGKNFVVPCIGSYLEPLIPDRDNSYARIQRDFGPDKILVRIAKHGKEYNIQESYQELENKSFENPLFTAIHHLHAVNSTYNACIIVTQENFETLVSNYQYYFACIQDCYLTKKEYECFKSTFPPITLTSYPSLSFLVGDVCWLNRIENASPNSKEIIVINAKPSTENNLQKHKVAIEEKAKAKEKEQQQNFVAHQKKRLSSERKIFIWQCVGLAGGIIVGIAVLCAWLYNKGVPLY